MKNILISADGIDCYHEKFIMRSDDNFIVGDIEVYRPKTLEQYTNLIQECERKQISFKLIRDINHISSNPRQYRDTIVIDLSFLHNISAIDERRLAFQPGVSQRELTDFIYQNKLNSRVPIRADLLNKLLTFETRHPELHLGDTERLEHPNRWLILSLASMEDLYRSFISLHYINQQIGSLLATLCVINTKSMMLYSDRLNFDEAISLNKQLLHDRVQEFPWQIVVEFKTDNQLTPILVDFIKQKIALAVESKSSLVHSLIRTFYNHRTANNNSDKTEHPLFEQGYHITLPYNVNSLIKFYHQVYLASLKYAIEPEIILDMSDLNALHVVVKIAEQHHNRHHILDFVLTISRNTLGVTSTH